jgi:methyl-accepting chemotaxis protein
MSLLSQFASWAPVRAVSESIRNKLLLTLGLLALLPLLLLGLFTNTLISRAVLRNQNETLAMLAREKEARLAALAERHVQLIEALVRPRHLRERIRQAASNNGGRTQALSDLRDQVRDMLRLTDDLEGIALVDAGGQLLVQTADGPTADSVRAAGYTDAMAGPGTVHVRAPAVPEEGTRVEQLLATTISDDPPFPSPSPPTSGERGMKEEAPVLGVLVLRFNLKGVQKIMAGDMGQTGESYLVNPRRQMVTQARLALPSPPSGGEGGVRGGDTVLRQTVELPGLREVLEKQHGGGQGVGKDYRGASVLYAYRWVPDLKAALVVKLDTEEAFDLIHRVFWLTAVLIGSTLGLVLVLAMWMTAGLTRQAGHVMDTVNRVGLGDFSARAEVTSGDELGVVAASLNAMLDNTVGLIQSREERDQIQRSIQKLLEEISGVAEGDLTKEAEVTADLTGAIADSFNFMIEQLRRVISNVQDATQQVGLAANQIHNRAEELVQGSEGQARQIVRTTEEVDRLAGSIRAVAEAAGESATVADQALSSARHGSSAVHDTIGGMNRIRDQVQETARRIKRLGESSQQIGEIVQLIEDIADRTSILALNAAIQAASAGEAGRGFAVVAQEVERLAERSAGATKKIAGLVKAIQGETREAVTAMEEGTREVVEGSRLANEAGQALARIETVSTKLAALIQSITEAAQQQAGGSQEVARAMGEISEVTQRTAEGTRMAAIAVQHLAAFADDLRGSVSTFRLPGRKSLAEIDVKALARQQPELPSPGKTKLEEVGV